MSSHSDSEKKVLNLYISKENSIRESADKIVIDVDGVLGDKFYSKDILRSILVTSIDSYKMAEDRGIEMPYGSLGENILVSINPYSLPLGSRLHVGEVVLEITQNCTLCKSLTKVDNRLPKLLKDDRGVFVKAIQGGTINVGDQIEIFKA
ncbi:hypothetical protein MNB_SV-6-200 [hydrothermal vent metagenome]|uniref:MOSC domain-containing protein n=1 Tax=hydrothermal vent metagenome TaxID=652676 RepID=A0A1W1BGM2_9ZZZZ